ncbi:MAG: hypothetical protein QMB22_00120 [Dehalococcoidia bacterium]|jgi:hypothetical protein|nr:MAG: hypothetical protein DK305_000590 [Chloroflexota bacterium]|tara:strand:+ start:4393 stop:5163 length:771 start_codon:yes stop_codon:yes gene_type:complete
MKLHFSQIIAMTILFASFLWLISVYQIFGNPITSGAIDKDTSNLPTNSSIINSQQNVHIIKHTANLRNANSIDSQIIAIIAGNEPIIIKGKDIKEKWAYISLQKSIEISGWTQIIHIAECQCSQTLPYLENVNINTKDNNSKQISSLEKLPDIVIYDSVILESGKLLLTLGNFGNKALSNSSFSIKITKINGEIVAIMEFGPSDIGINKFTSFITPVSLEESGLYIIHIDYLNEIKESIEDNNILSDVYLIKTNEE